MNEPTRQQGKTRAQEGATPHWRGTVLVAEDMPDNQRLFSLYLDHLGMRVRVVENGALALNACEQQVFDVVLMDMHMPVMDGLSTVCHLRKRGYTAPIVALTANTRQADQAHYYAAGCDDFLAKPLDRTRLAEVLDRFLPAEHPGKPQQLAEELTMITPDLPPDLANDADFLYLLARFVERLPQTLEQAEALIGNQQWQALTQLMHDLKGSAGGYGFAELTQQAERIHTLLREGDNEPVPALLGEIKVYCQRIVVDA